jgi:predicted permease
MISNLLNDIRYGIRQLRRSPAFGLVAILALGIGIGANVTVFGFINAFLFRPMDVKDPGSLVRIFGEGGNTPAAMATFSSAYISVPDYYEYRDRNQSFSNLAAQFIGGPGAVRIDGPPQMIPVIWVSANYFDTVGVPAAMGRPLKPEDGLFAAADVIVLSDSGWHRYFGADANIIGKTAVIDGIAKTIVGVMPEWFRGTNAPMVPQIYTPIRETTRPVTFPVWLLGRVKPGVTPGQARADLTRIAAQLTDVDKKRRPIEVYPASMLMPFLIGPISLFSTVIVIIVGVVLLIVCDNVAIFVLTRTAARRREIAVRLALGVSRGRLISALLAESLLVCIGGGLVGLFAAHTTARLLTQIYSSTPMPFALTYSLDWRVLVYTITLSGVASLFCGLTPAFQSFKTDVVAGLRGSGLTAHSRIRSGLVITQVTLSTALIVVTVILVNSINSRTYKIADSLVTGL